jgi:hypothetical protein
VANQGHLAILRQGTERWNAWRLAHAAVRPDLSGTTLVAAKLAGINLADADLREVDFRTADLRGAQLSRANCLRVSLVASYLMGACLHRADLIDSRLINADLSGADLSGACLRAAHLGRVNFSGANLTGVDMTWCGMNNANLEGAIIRDCNIHGIAAWDLKISSDTQQSGLIITSEDDAAVIVDDIEVAQFIYLLLNNPNIRAVISTVANRAVLILGRFTAERKAVLERIKEALREDGFVPILFDFEPAPERDVTETVQLLANLSRFVIADITGAKSIPQELSAIVPHLPSVPIQPILLAGQREYGMFAHWRRYPWVLPEFLYADADHLIANLEGAVIQPAIAKKDALRDSLTQEAHIQELEQKVREQQQEIDTLRKDSRA